MDAVAINKAVSGEAIYHDARRMYAGSDYTTEELDQVDVLVISHVHNQNVANTANLKDNLSEYTGIENTTDYAVGYDYVIKKYMADCAALENNPASAYYGVEGGKPARIMLTTHWHDSRTVYNEAIRTLAQKWNFPLVEFDVNIGFSKGDDAADPGAPSRAMAHDKETINGVDYGWHPKRGVNSPIQRRMAAIFTKAVEKAYQLEFPFEVNVVPVSPIYLEGEEVRLSVNFKNGMFPYSLAGDHTASSLEGNRYIITADPLSENTSYSLSASDSSASQDVSLLADSNSKVDVLLADYYALPDFDSYVSQLNQSANYDFEEVLQLKNSYNASRKSYISFQASENMPRNADKVVLRIYYKDNILGYFNDESGRPQEGIEILGVEGNSNVYSSNNINWSTSSNHDFELIDSYAEVTSDMTEGWVGIDVTDWANKTLDDLEALHGNLNTGHLTFRIFVLDNNSNALMNFYSSDADASKAPQLLFGTMSEEDTTSLNTLVSELKISGNRILNPMNEEVRIYGIDGILRYVGYDSEISLEPLAHGIFIIHTGNQTLKVKK